MNRTPPTRLAALLVAVLFLLNGVESAFGMHRCPHHDLVAGASGGHAAHQVAEYAGHAGAEDHSAPGTGHAPCTCQGDCQMGSAAALPEASAAAPSVAVSSVAVRPLRAEERAARRHSPYFLPYSQAPPRVG